MSIENPTNHDITDEPEYKQIQECMSVEIKQKIKLMRQKESLIRILINEKKYSPREVAQAFKINTNSFVRCMNVLKPQWWIEFSKQEKIPSGFERILSDKSKIDPIVDKIKKLHKEYKAIGIKNYTIRNLKTLQPYFEKYGVTTIEKILGINGLRFIITTLHPDWTKIKKEKYIEYIVAEKELLSDKKIKTLIQEFKNLKEERKNIISAREKLVQQLIDNKYPLTLLSKIYKIPYLLTYKQQLNSPEQKVIKEQKKLTFNSRNQIIFDNEEFIRIISSMYIDSSEIKSTDIPWVQDLKNNRQRLFDLCHNKINNWNKIYRTIFKAIINKNEERITDIAVNIWEIIKELAKIKNIQIEKLNIEEIDNLRWEALTIWLQHKINNI